MANIVFHLLGNVADLIGILIDIASTNPFSAILIVSGIILLVFSFGFFGYLVLGAIISGLTPESIGRTPPQ
ncbi:MAG TPA: hypothetical protein VFJ06_11055 [Halococcus sp.]|nr:hypothetical protein [Halococcus sp.]